ncbi:MAG: ROK family protein [Candidatus Hinthialibacter sp.]
MTRVAIGIDLGGTDIKGGLVAEDGTIIQTYIKSTEGRLGGRKVVDRIGDLIQEILDSEAMQGRRDDLQGIGVGSPGLVDQEKGAITRPVNIPDWDYWINVREIFQERFGLFTWADNDANVGALGEALFGKGKGHKVVMVLTLGTGVGGGIVINSEVFHGACGFGGELGHIMVNPSGPVCNCGNEGCLETYTSANAIAKYAQDRIRVEHIPSILKDMARENDGKVTSKMVYEAALQKDSVALQTVKRAGIHLGIGIATLVVAFNPSIVCIGGGASKMGDMLLDHARKQLEKRVFFHSHFATPITQAALGNEAGFVGAAGLALTGRL